MALKFIGSAVAAVIIGTGVGNFLVNLVRPDEKDLIKVIIIM